MSITKSEINFSNELFFFSACKHLVSVFFFIYLFRKIQKDFF